MMSLKSFHLAVRAVANGRYFAVQIEATEHSDASRRLDKESKPVGITYRAYVDGLSWTKEHTDPEDALVELRAMRPKELPAAPVADASVLDAVGELP
jgi:hypothetical protein